MDDKNSSTSGARRRGRGLRRARCRAILVVHGLSSFDGKLAL